jgi:branched-chain amino acid transport system substrate-binding protein
VGNNTLNNFNIALDEINAAGGINGRKVELVVEDSQNDAKQAVQIAQNFIENEDILCMLTGGNSTCDLATASFCQDAGFVQLSGMASNAKITPTGDYIFSVAGRSTAETPFAVEDLAIGFLKSTKIAVLYENSEWGTGVYQIAKEIVPEAGAEIVAGEQFSADETDYSSVLSKVRNADPEVVLIVSQYAAAGLIVNKIAEMGWDVKIAGTPAMVNQNFLDLVGENGNGVTCFASMAFSKDLPLSMEYYDKYVERYNVEPTNHAACYEALTLVAKAAGTCGDNLTRDTLRDAIAATVDFEGLNGSYSIEEDGNVTRKYHIMECQDGVWVKVG